MQHTKENKEELELVLEQVKIETKDEKYHVDRLVKGVAKTYDKIPKSAQIAERTTTQKIDQIEKKIDQYR
jgi:hypothetical protein